jgi:mannose-1-phosphate guanylyltransferase
MVQLNLGAIFWQHLESFMTKISSSNHRFALILAGGTGTRLWPRSRGATPKQFLRLVGAQTMLQLTVKRALKLVDLDHIIVISNRDHLHLVQQQLPDLPANQILLEPAKKDTALAMLVGALYARALDPDAIVINSASDHYVSEEDLAEFAAVMRQASDLAASHQHLITVGISPKRPETGFGYIKVGEQLDSRGHVPVFHVDNFTEKPSEATAAAFIATGKYFWNANMYVWSSQALINAFQKYAPQIYQLAKPLLTTPAAKFSSKLAKIYREASPISIDFAISEKADNLLLLPGNFSWSDVGDWRTTYDLGKADANSNVHSSEIDQAPPLVVHHSYGNLLASSTSRLVALVGIKDLLIVDTPDVLLLTTKNHSQDVKKIVESLQQKNQTKYL